MKKELIVKAKNYAKKSYETHFVKFTYFSILTGIIDIAIFYILVELTALYYVYSAVIGYVIGTALNWYFNRKLNFTESKREPLNQLTLFMIICLIGLGISAFFLFLFVEYLGMHYLIARVLSAIIAFSWSYTINKSITFRN